MKINTNLFIEDPKNWILDDKSRDYVPYWKEQKRRCVYGYTIAGVWMSGKLYHYINFGTIEIDVKRENKSFKKRGKPFLRDIDWEVMNAIEQAEQEQKGVLLVSGRGCGKCQGKGTKIVMSNGMLKNIEEIIVGDFVMTIKGPQKVIKTHSGVDDMYEVVQNKGIRYTVNSEHLVSLRRNSSCFSEDRKDKNKKYIRYPKLGKEVIDISTKDLIKQSKKFFSVCSGYKDYCNFENKDLKIDPYFLGLWLGDGNTDTMGITTLDKEIKYYIEKVAKEYSINVRISQNSKKTCPTYYLTNHRKLNPLVNLFKQYNLFGNKHIPDDFKINCKENRLKLLAGLIDTDGYNHHGYYTITQKSEKLIKDIKFVADSLGFRTVLKPVFKTIKSINFRGKYFELSIMGNVDEIPVLLERKKIKNKKPNKDHKLTRINEVKYIGQGEYYGFTLENCPYYFLEDFTICHNSYWAAECIAHTFTFVDDSESILSSEDDKYIHRLYKSIELNLNNQPLPFKKVRTGTLKDGVWNQWKDKKTGENLGTNSRILSRNYKNNSMAANGTRPKFHVMEEIGTMKNLKADYQDSIECWRNEYGQFAVPFLVGTGGDFDKGNDAAEMFREPEAYNLISINDEWETNTQVSLFIPATKTKNEFKKEISFAEYLGLNEDGEFNSVLDQNKILVSDEPLAKKHFEVIRDIKRKASDPMLLQKEMMYNPFVPSEAFIKTSSNRFNIEQLKHYLYILETKYKDLGIPVELYINSNTGKVESKPNNKKPLYDFPLKKDVTDRSGSVVIYEYPIDNPPHGMYIAGIDPYDQEDGNSLGSIYIYKRFNGFSEKGLKESIVAEYTGRPNTGTSARDFYEICRLLLLYYNAKGCPENQNPGIITHFFNKHYDYLFTDQLELIRNISPESKMGRSKGIHMSAPIKSFGLGLIKEYLEEEIFRNINEKGELISITLGYERIKSIPLLKELIQYDDEGNFDRIMSFLVLMLYREEIASILPDKVEKEEEIDFFADTQNFFRKGYIR